MKSDPEPSPEEDLQDTQRQVYIYDAIAPAASDAHAVLDGMLAASDPDGAKQALVDRYAFSTVQASAVMAVQFRRLTAASLNKIEQWRHELVSGCRKWSSGQQ